MTEAEMLKELQKIDTPTVTNVVATYPGDPLSLDLYDPWNDNWYTDNSLGCWYPELGAMAGYAVTCVFGLPDPNVPEVGFMEFLEAVDNAPSPSIVCFDQRFPKEIANKVGLSGGNMTSNMMACGAIGAITNGPSRDIHEIRPMDFQYLTNGICAGHGPQVIHAIQVPVHMSGMDVTPGEIIHMDENGAVKFPADKLEVVLTNAKKLFDLEEERVGANLTFKGKGLAALKTSLNAGDPYIKKEE